MSIKIRIRITIRRKRYRESCEKEEALPHQSAPARESLFGCEGNSAGVALVHDHEMAAAIAPHAQEAGFAVGLSGQFDRFLGIADRLAIDLLDHIAGPQTRFRSRRIRRYVGHDRPFYISRQIKLLP